MFISHRQWGNTTLQGAAYVRNLIMLQKMWEWDEFKLTTEEIHNKVLLAADNTGKTAYHEAEFDGNLNI